MSNEEHTAAYKIFHYYFFLYIPQHFLYNAEIAKEYGTPTSGDKDIDRALANSQMLCQLTIAEMAEKLDQGASMTLQYPEKSAVIYEILRQHLVDWDNHVRLNIGDVDAPLDDLYMLDRLADEIYKIARHYIKTLKPINRLVSNIENLNNRRAMGRRLKTDSNANSLPQAHKSLADSIAKRNI